MSLWCDRALLEIQTEWERTLLVLFVLLQEFLNYFCGNEQYVVGQELSTSFTHI